MVPREELEKEQPATLPADFGEWDSGEPPATQPADFNGFDHLPDSGNARKPQVNSVSARAAVLPPVADRLPKPTTHAPAKVHVDAYRAPQFESLKDMEEETEDTGKHKKTLLFVSIGVLVLLLALVPLGYFMSRSKSVTPNQSAVSQQTTTNVQKPTPAMSANAATTTTTTDDQSATTTTTAEKAVPLSAQAAAMSHQLSAPSRIPNDLKMLAGKEASPSSGFSASGMEGVGNSGGNVFGGQSGPKVKVEAPKKVNISAGIAVGLLIKKTAPVYPPIARSAHVSGTVVIQATISKGGSVENLRVISGPAMLRQSAQDAVKTWRFRPYLLDGEPVEVDTTVNVTFALAQ
jgi:TonB family protein